MINLYIFTKNTISAFAFENIKVEVEKIVSWLWWVLFYSAHLRTDSDISLLIY